jgi:hypothetical protein
MAQGFLGLPATESGWETATKGGGGEGEALKWSCREVQATGNSAAGHQGDWRPHFPDLE